MALLDICLTTRDTAASVESARGNTGSVLDMLTSNEDEPSVLLVITAGSGGESAFTFQS